MKKVAPTKAAPGTSAASKAATKSAAKSVTKAAPAKAAARPAVKAAAPAPAKAAVKPVAKSAATKAAAAPVAKPVAKAAIKPASKPTVAAPSRKAERRIAGLTETELMRAPADRYMDAGQMAYFRECLMEMRNEILEKADATSEHLREHEIEPDPTDQATIEEEYALELRARDRERDRERETFRAKHGMVCSVKLRIHNWS